MAKTDNLTDFLTGVANAIRTKKGTTAKINPQNFETEIGSITTSKPEQEKMISLIMSSGNQVVLPDSGKVLSKVTIIKPTSLVPENIKKGIDIGDVIGTLEVTSKPEQEKIATPSNVQQIISPDADMTLSKVTIKAAPLPASNNDRYKNVDGCLIENENKILLLGSSESIIPSDGSITSIGDYAFSGCRGLINITIPNSVTNIGKFAFSYCFDLKNASIGNGVTIIDDCAFLQCGLTSITIPNSVINVRDTAFRYCNSLTSIIVDEANKIYYSENNCFIEKSTKTLIFGCKTSIIPNDIANIGDGAFYSCIDLKNAIIPNSVTSIGSDAFFGCWSLTSIIIPDSVTNIGKEAFWGCDGLTSVTIGGGITSIEEGVFRDCPRLTSITIPDSVTSIKPYAFEGCSGLTSITIPDGVTSIGSSAFEGCSGLTSVTYLGTVDQWVEISFSNDSSNPIYNAHNLYINDELVTEVNLTTATKISPYAFRKCIGLTSITISDSVKRIGYYAFSGCSGLTSVTIPSSLTSIGESVFSYCSSLTSVTIPDSVISIGKDAFSSCSGLTSVTIGNGVTRIGNRAFYNCSSLTSITMLSTTPPTIESLTLPFGFSGTITVPAGTGATYKAATNWSKYADKIQEAAA